ncbi:hypothetical protein Peur_049710 [Populus x canadensis]
MDLVANGSKLQLLIHHQRKPGFHHLRDIIDPDESIQLFVQKPPDQAKRNRDSVWFVLLVKLSMLIGMSLYAYTGLC